MVPGEMNRELGVELLVGDTRPWDSDDPDAKPIVTSHPVDQRDSVPVPDGYYFLMSELTLNTHAGTHIEIPYHCLKGEKDFTELPLDQFFGPALFLRFTGFQEGCAIELSDVKKAAQDAGGIRAGDIVFIETGYSVYFFEDSVKYLKAPYPTADAVQWVVSHDIKMLGFDSGFIESPRNPRHDNHLIIMESGASLVENMAHLDRVKGNRAVAYCFPLAIKGADSMPVRIVAVEGVEE